MKLNQLSAKPVLVLVSLDDEATITEFGEALEFHTWDRQPMDVFMKLANMDQSNPGAIIDIVKTLILDEAGKPILSDDNMLPTKVLMRAIAKVSEQLGK
jgi:hypothetical protein